MVNVWRKVHCTADTYVLVRDDDVSSILTYIAVCILVEAIACTLRSDKCGVYVALSITVMFCGYGVVPSKDIL